MDLHRLFNEHPASVGESYWRHLRRASWFGSRMLMGAGASFVHALFPFLFVKTGSATIIELHTAMVTHRVAGHPRPVDVSPQAQEAA